jgi:glycosyltransferase involved in cell wall biosynthesis
MNKPTVAHLLPNYNAFPPVIPAGTELRVEQVSLRQQRYRPVVVAGWFDNQPVQEEIGSMRVRRIRFGRVYRRLFQKISRLDPLPYGKRMWRIVQEEGAKILHIHNEPKLLNMLAPLLQQQPMPVVVHIANQKPFKPENLGLVSRFVACSHFMARWLIEIYHIPAEKVAVIYTGVDVGGRPPVWEITEAHRQHLRVRWGIGQTDALVFLFGGRLVQEKGVREMLDAFALLRERSPVPVKLLIAGNVRESNDPKNEKTNYGRAMVEKMAGMADVHWVGSLPPSVMHDFLLAGDVFLLPSLWDDPYPTVMLEAAAAGLPIVAAARGGMTEFLQDCPSFDFVEKPEDPESLCQVMIKLATSSSLRETQGRWLRHVIETHYDWSRVTADFEQLYDTLLPTV